MTRKYTVTNKVKESWNKKADWSKRMNVVRLRELEGLSFREIGEIYGTSAQSVQELYHKAKGQIDKVEKKNLFNKIFKK